MPIRRRARQEQQTERQPGEKAAKMENSHRRHIASLSSPPLARDSNSKNTLRREKLRERALPGGRLKRERVEDEALLGGLPPDVFVERVEALRPGGDLANFIFFGVVVDFEEGTQPLLRGEIGHS